MGDVNIKTEEHVAVIDVPDIMTGESALDLRDAAEHVRRDEEAWVVVLVVNATSHTEGENKREFDAGAVEEKRVADSVAAIEKPVVFAVSGDAMDQVLELALACDVRIASDASRFGLTQIKDGLIPWDGGTQRLPRLVGRSRAMEMVLSARVLDAREALEIGLVNETVPLESVNDRAREIAQLIAGHGPIATRYLKEAILKGADLTLDQGLRLEADLNLLLQTTTDRAEGIGSFLERRRPKYRGE
ncbi:MAG: enoyl-CoA hydratase/isomerase family protein [Chloroflexi bacterium]|nr:enoyl-CoA hydratase/isomerase family protein [Chloroflexota bacterium]